MRLDKHTREASTVLCRAAWMRRSLPIAKGFAHLDSRGDDDTEAAKNRGLTCQLINPVRSGRGSTAHPFYSTPNVDLCTSHWISHILPAKWFFISWRLTTVSINLSLFINELVL